MKRLALFVALALALFTAYAQAVAPAWPINSKTGAVVFTGSAKWPDSVSTDARRAAYVRRWYFKHLTEAQPADVDAAVASSKRLGTSAGITYPELSRACVIQSHAYLLGYALDITTSTTGFAYRLSDFGLTTPEDYELTLSAALKEKRHQQALAAFRARLAVAQAALQ